MQILPIIDKLLGITDKILERMSPEEQEKALKLSLSRKRRKSVQYAREMANALDIDFIKENFEGDDQEEAHFRNMVDKYEDNKRKFLRVSKHLS